METCENCGCKVYGGYYINCNEEHFIEEQYLDSGEEVPKIISKKSKIGRQRGKEKNEIYRRTFTKE